VGRLTDKGQLKPATSVQLFVGASTFRMLLGSTRESASRSPPENHLHPVMTAHLDRSDCDIR
jgi:hypothetical protein